MPEGVGLGQKSLKLIDASSREVASFNFVSNTAANTLPILIADPSTICSDTAYIDKDGAQQAGGTKNCATAACTAKGQKDCVATGDYVASTACIASGDQNCIATGTYFAGTACADNGSNCFLPTYAASTQPRKAIDFDEILSVIPYVRLEDTIGGERGTLDYC